MGAGRGFYVFALLRFRGGTEFAANSLGQDIAGVLDVFITLRSRECYLKENCRDGTWKQLKKWAVAKAEGSSGRGEGVGGQAHHARMTIRINTRAKS